MRSKLLCGIAAVTVTSLHPAVVSAQATQVPDGSQSAPPPAAGAMETVPQDQPTRSVGVQAATPANTADVATGAEETNTAQIADIIVTATRRSENLQNVPVAVSAISSAALKNAGVFETSDLNRSLPNLQVSSPYGKQQPNFSVRGVGVGTEFNANAASPVGVYVDEVYQAFRSSHGQQLYDLNQIEVVRGPQGTLYGRNTTGGAINFITHGPSLEGQEGYVTLGYGNFNRRAAEGAVEVTPVADTFGIRIAGTYVDSDPYLHNILPAGLNTSVAGGASGLNRNSGRSPGGYKSTGLRISMRFKPSEDLDLGVKVYAGESIGGTEPPIPTGQSKNSDVIDYTSPTFLLGGLFSSLAPTGLVPTSYSRDARGLKERQLELDTIGSAESRARGAVFNAKLRLSDTLRLINITGYDDGEYLQTSTDCDGSPLRLCAIGYGSKFHAFNQDTRLDFTSGKVKFIVGGFYGKDVVTTDNRPDFFNLLSDVRTAVGLPASYFNPGGNFNGTILSATSLPTGIRAENHFRQTRSSLAAYGEGSYQITDTLKITAGLRYTKDKNRFKDGLTTYYDDAGVARLVSVSGFQQGGAFAPYFLQPVLNEAGEVVVPAYSSLGLAPPTPLERKGSSNRLSGRAIIDWKPTDRTLLYASYSRGYRAGTFNGLAYGSANQVYFVPPETVNAYEAGFKSRFFDNRFQLNAAVFYYDYKGQQGQVVDATATANLISLDGTLKGLEVDAQLVVTRRLRFSAAFGLLDSSYKDGDCPSTPVTGFPAQIGSCVVSSGGAVSVAGNPFPFAAKSSVNLGGDWDVFDIGEGKFTLHADASYTGRFYYDSFKDYSRPPLTSVTTGKFANGEGNYWVVNARATATIGQVSISGWVKNLTDTVYYPYGIALENLFGNGYRARNEPRTYGIDATVRF
ncbi:TonB-dependent receptor [Sphingomonas sp. ID0503]|uniref:TonB-dependent receptor n=1 Tax=Sphingomonas sp. ID0503 TaxID=3399691 RepID=UPI003AFAEEAC